MVEASDALDEPEHPSGCPRFSSEQLDLACLASALKPYVHCDVPNGSLRTLGLLVVVTPGGSLPLGAPCCS